VIYHEQWASIRPIGSSFSIIARLRDGTGAATNRLLRVWFAPAQRQGPSRFTDRRTKGKAGRAGEKASGSDQVFGLFYKRHPELLDRARTLGLEGLIGKRAGSRYEAGKRNGAWIKVKLHLEQEFVIGGYTEPEEVVREMAG
jgi:ATP dependent DNA ligase-like protein